MDRIEVDENRTRWKEIVVKSSVVPDDFSVVPCGGRKTSHLSAEYISWSCGIVGLILVI